MLECFNGCGVGGESVRFPGPEQPDHLGEWGVGSGTIEQLHPPQAFTLEPPGRLSHARVIAFRQDDPSPHAPRPFVDAAQEAHFANLRFNACCTAGWTSADTSPPNRATSRTRLELR